MPKLLHELSYNVCTRSHSEQYMCVGLLLIAPINCVCGGVSAALPACLPTDSGLLGRGGVCGAQVGGDAAGRYQNVVEGAGGIEGAAGTYC